MISEREAVKREREAFDAGVAVVWRRFNLADDAYGKGWEGSEVLAAERYPLPKLTRPRVVVMETQYGPLRLRVSGDVPMYAWARYGEDIWHRFGENANGSNESVAKEIIAFIRGYADLLANPTELVDDDA